MDISSNISDSYASDYSGLESPKTQEDIEKQHKRLVEKTSENISNFYKTTKLLTQKVQVLNTKKDSRSDRELRKELIITGNAQISAITKQLERITTGAQGNRVKRIQANKLSSDFKKQVKVFQDLGKKIASNEQHAIDELRLSTFSARSSFEQEKPDFSGMNEQQLFERAQVIQYNEDDLARREEDILQINHQLREVNAAYKEVNDLIVEQDQVVVEVADAVETARDNVEGALTQVQQADKSRGFCQCSKTKLICYGFFTLIVAVLVLSLVVALKP